MMMLAVITNVVMSNQDWVCYYVLSRETTASEHAYNESEDV